MESSSSLVYWDLEFKGIEDQGMREILNAQRKEANDLFCRYIENNYEDWFNGQEEAPDMAHHLLKEQVFPVMEKERVFLMVIDNLRYDQWKVLEPLFSENITLYTEEMYYTKNTTPTPP